MSNQLHWGEAPKRQPQPQAVGRVADVETNPAVEQQRKVLAVSYAGAPVVQTQIQRPAAE